jgi:hypothetical protein
MITALRFNETRLRKLLTDLSPHLPTMLDGALKSFEHTENPVRFANTANTLRELFRELMEAVAPNTEIRRTCWFKPDTSSKNGITRRHRCRFSVYGYVDPSNFAKNFAESVDDLTKDILDGIDQLNAFTHITRSSLARAESDAVDVFSEVLENLASLFEVIGEARERLNMSLENILHEAFGDLFTSEFFDDLDQLSTHTRPQGATNIEFEIDDIDEEEMRLSGSGTVECDLQYGSDGDCERGDGVEWPDAFPFTFNASARVADIKQVSVNPSDVSINTDKYYGYAN